MNFLNKLEEALLAFLLMAMTALTFANVVARYAFNDNILWVLEATVFLFAWMVLLGACYAVKKNLHIGIDVLAGKLSARAHYIVTLLASIVCILFAILLFVGSWNYWYPFVSERAWLEVNDIPMLDALRFLEPWLNDNEAYDKLPVFIPYAILPLSTALLTWRFCQAAWNIFHHRQPGLIATYTSDTTP